MMWPETLSLELQQRAIEELVKGKDFAIHLKRTLLIPQNQNQNELLGLQGGASINCNKKRDQYLNLVLEKITDSFTNTLSIILNNNNNSDRMFHHHHHHEEEVLSDQLIPNNNNKTKSEHSGAESMKSSSKLKDRRGCYKRRKGSKSVVKESCSWVDDGYAWRKYGQKSILGSKYPRNYFRCTYRHEQGCGATKQVQETGEDKYHPKFRTVYYGHHTCKVDDVSPLQCQYRSNSNHGDVSSSNTSNQTTTYNSKYSASSPSPTFTFSTKQENQEEYYLSFGDNINPPGLQNNSISNNINNIYHQSSTSNTNYDDLLSINDHHDYSSLQQATSSPHSSTFDDFGHDGFTTYFQDLDFN